jgi:hypothetical protein
MGLLGDVDQVEARFSPFGNSVNLDVRYGLGLHRTYHRLKNYFGHNRWYSYVTWAKWKLISVYLEIVLNSTQDGCTVCAERTIGSEIILDAPDCTPR